jgi:hypothetical protein
MLVPGIIVKRIVPRLPGRAMCELRTVGVVTEVGRCRLRRLIGHGSMMTGMTPYRLALVRTFPEEHG